MAGKMPEQVPAQVAGHANKGRAGNPARHPPEEIVRRNESNQDDEGGPGVGSGTRPSRSSAEGVNKQPLTAEDIADNLQTIMDVHHARVTDVGGMEL